MTADPEIRYADVMTVGKRHPIKVLWSVHHPRTGMVLRHGQAFTRHGARKKAEAAARRWADEYGHLQR